MADSSQNHVVITGVGFVSPLGNSVEKFWSALMSGANGVKKFESIPAGALPTDYGAEARDFSGHIDDFGPLTKDQKRSIRKNLKVMCREIQMGVAAAQLAVADAGLSPEDYDPQRSGVVYGSDYMMTVPQEYSAGVQTCIDEQGAFQFEDWATQGLPEVTPLWLLKYLPNMPASHIAIFNDMRGPNNSLTLREASSYAAVGESLMTIIRGHADLLIAGATGTRIHPMRSVQAVSQEVVAQGDENQASVCRPFDKNRVGMILGEGAGAIIVESVSAAEKRGAKIYGEVLGAGSSAVIQANGEANRKQALINSMSQAIRESGVAPEEIGHINAHGSSTQQGDIDETQAIQAVFGQDTSIPVVATKANFGNLGAASGMVELISSLLITKNEEYFPNPHFETPDPRCSLNLVTERQPLSNKVFLCSNVTPQGQAASLVVRGA